MSKLKWTEEKLPSLGLIFLRTVMDNMREEEDATVKFGTTGQGIKPHYQVVFPTGTSINFNGLNHEKYARTEPFDESNLSAAFELGKIRKAYEGTKGCK